MAASYSEGYERGYSDGLAGRGEVNVGNFLGNLKNDLNPFASSDRYREGYSEGYRKGCQKREEDRRR